ncbi:hypothetical protein QQ045_029743 [Rhodiola kirilowii]
MGISSGCRIGELVFGLIVVCLCIGLDGEEEQLRLPKFAVPKHYSIRLQPDLVLLKFNGSVEIEVDILERTESKQKQRLVRPVKMHMDSKSQIIVLEFGEGLPIGVGVLGIKFSGKVNPEVEGLFWRPYTVNGEERNMLATQFESIFARKCFPCWDEPAFKATFTMTLDVPSHLMALSNMPVINETTAGLIKTVYFQKSPLMSTYLVAVAIGHFDHIEGHTSDGIKVRVYCPINRTNEGVFALKVGIMALDFYKEYLSMPFALPKLDMIALPDFPGGMENYGLIMFGESMILLDDQSLGVHDQQRVAEYVTHELAHQWFGNLVTLEWWTDIWLNEAFATWLNYKAVDSLFPEWDSWFKFIIDTESILLEDASADTHPVVVKINHLSEIDGLPVNHVFDSWVKKKGFPVVSVKVNLNVLELRQSQISASDGDQHWIVPIRLCCGAYEACHDIILQRKAESFDLRKLEGCSCTYGTGRNEKCPWIKINANRTGFYRVVYGESLVSGLQHAVESKQFSTYDRYALLTDSYQLENAPRQNLTYLLSLMSAYSKENNKDIVDQLTMRIEDIVKITSDATPQQVSCIKKIFIGILENYAKKVGWEATQG